MLLDRKLGVELSHLISRGEFNPKGTAFPRLGVQAEGASHFMDPSLDNRQSHPSAGIPRAGVQPLKDFENAILVFGSDADAIVRYTEPDAVIFLFGANAYIWADSGRD